MVRLGLLFPNPTKQAVQSLCTFVGAQYTQLMNFEQALGVNGPAYAELQYLMRGYGYGVYKEGFDIVFHYTVCSERERVKEYFLIRFLLTYLGWC